MTISFNLDETEKQPEQIPEPDRAERFGLTPKDPFDPAPVETLFSRYHVELDGWKKSVEALEVKDAASSEAAANMAGQIKKVLRAAEKERKRIKAPILKFTKFLDSRVRAISDRLREMLSEIKDKQRPYLIEQDRLRREAAEKAMREAAEADRKFWADAKAAAAAGERLPDLPTVPPPVPAEMRVEGEAGTAKWKSVTKWEFIYPGQLVDDAYKTLSAAGLENFRRAFAPYVNARIKLGEQIPGVKIWYEVEVDNRARR